MKVILQTQPFDPGFLLTAFGARHPEAGAVASFSGYVRAEGGDTGSLELEAYPGLTDVEIGRFGGTAAERFGLIDWLVVHRIGLIPAGEAIVFVATASRHRREAFEACDYLMDYLKSRAPFWKKSHGPDGARWIEPTDRDRTDLERWETP